MQEGLREKQTRGGSNMQNCCFLNPIFDRYDQKTVIGYFCASSKPCVADTMSSKRLEVYTKQKPFHCPLIGVGAKTVYIKVDGDKNGAALSDEA